MKRSRIILILAGSLAAVVFIWGFTRKTTPPNVPFTRVTRTTVVSSLSTNGKVEPIEWATARAERQGLVQKISVVRGQQVKRGDVLVTLDTNAASAEVAAAQSDIATAEAQRQIIQQGGSAQDRVQIENDLAGSRAALQTARKEVEVLERLVAKQAATKIELDTARQRVDQALLQIQALEKRRAALVAPTELPVNQARLNQAQSAEALARQNVSRSVIRAPIAGAVYQFDLKPGSFLNPGDLVAEIGRLDHVRTAVYVDEPDLGRVAKGMPVSITWDALPGKQWKGIVDRLPTQVIALGSRQVGEVTCLIDNPGRDLLPGTNVNAEIESKVVPNAVSIPKEALRREGTVSGVYVLAGDKIVWRPVEIGISSYTRAQVLRGLTEGDAIALPTDKPIKTGMKVTPTYPTH